MAEISSKKNYFQISLDQDVKKICIILYLQLRLLPTVTASPRILIKVHAPKIFFFPFNVCCSRETITDIETANKLLSAIPGIYFPATAFGYSRPLTANWLQWAVNRGKILGSPAYLNFRVFCWRADLMLLLTGRDRKRLDQIFSLN